MKWLDRIHKALKCGLILMRWFEASRADGIITHQEMLGGVQELIEAAGLVDELQLEVPPPEGLSA